MIVNIENIKYYGRFYKSNKREYENIWYFCFNDYKIYNVEELFEKFSFTSEIEIYQSDMYIPIFKTDIEDLEKKFIGLYGLDGKIFRQLLSSENDYDISFKIFIDHYHYNMWYIWHDYESEHLIKDAIAWCKENSIPYTLK